MLTEIAKGINNSYLRLLEVNPINNGYGLARSVLAMGTFLTLVFNSTDTLFLASTEISRIGISQVVDYSLFILLADNILLARSIAIIVLFLVIIGIRPRFTGILHWYISFSFFAGCSIIDGGDQANAVVTFLLIPLTLVDGRRWHWEQSTEKKPGLIQNSISWSIVFLIRIQVCVIYLHAAVAKFQVPEWVNGTATYYWFTHHYHGAAGYIKPMIVDVMSKSAMVVLISWGTIALELLLFSAIIMRPESWRRKSLLVAGLVFHFFIVIVHGLISFYFTMAGALLLYLLDYKVSLDFKKPKIKKIWMPS